MSQALYRTFKSNYVPYFPDGNGRDRYIAYDNAGFYKNVIGTPKSLIGYKTNTFLSTKIPFHMKTKSIKTPNFHYHADGTGRDKYIIVNGGGLFTDMKPLISYKLTDFLRNNEDNISPTKKTRTYLSRDELKYNKLLKNIEKNSTIIDAFKLADSTLKQGVVGITTLLSSTGLVNVDFNDVKSVMENTGMAHLGMCEKTGEDAIKEAVKGAAQNALSETTIKGAKGVIINISGSKELSLADINSALTEITDDIDENSNIIFGTIIDEKLKNKTVVTIIATGVDDVAL